MLQASLSGNTGYSDGPTNSFDAPIQIVYYTFGVILEAADEATGVTCCERASYCLSRASGLGCFRAVRCERLAVLRQDWRREAIQGLC